MDVRFLESLLEIVATGSIASAARKQGLTAAAVSGRIKKLETQLETQLLHRNAHSATPTNACLNLLPRAKNMVAQTKLLKSDTDPSGLSGALNIGCIASSLTQVLPPIIRAIKTQAPKAELRIKPADSKQLYDLLLSKQLDAAIITKPDFTTPKSINILPLFSQQLVLIAKSPTQHNLADELATNPFIAYDKAGWGGKQVNHWVDSLGLPKNILCTLDSLETICQLVDEGMGISILPAWYGLYKNFSHLNITPLTALGFQPPSRTICLLTNKLAEKRCLLKIVKNSIVNSYNN